MSAYKHGRIGLKMNGLFQLFVYESNKSIYYIYISELKIKLSISKVVSKQVVKLNKICERAQSQIQGWR